MCLKSWFRTICGFGAALQFDYDAHAVAIAFVADVGDVVDDLVVDQFARCARSRRALFTWYGISVTMIACLSLVMFSMAALARIMKRPRPVRVGFEDSRAPVDEAAGREVGALHELQHLGQLRVGIVHQRDGGVDDFREIVRRNVRRHADGDSVRAVHEQIRNARRQNVGLDLAVVIVRTKVDCLFVDIFEQRGRNCASFASV